MSALSSADCGLRCHNLGVDRHWLLDRGDPRTVLAGSVGVLLLGLLAVVTMVREGGLLAAFAVVWVLVALVHLVHAAVRLRRFRNRKLTP